ncbi:MAG: M1 family aminopeptidase [Syntrophothermus sp.]
MKKMFTIFFLLSISLGLFAQDKGSTYCYEKKIKSDGLVDLLQEKAIKHSFDVLNYKLDLNIYSCFISPYPKNFAAEEVITIKADSAINSISLNAVNSSLTIASVSDAGASFTHVSNMLNITLNRTYNPGEVFNVKINYNHNNVSDGAIYVSGGFFFTDAEPEGARKWFPSYDRPSDKATVDITARTPVNVKLGSNGRLADSTVSNDTLYYRWISRDPVATYLVVIASKVNYNLDIVNWTNPRTSEIVPIRFYWNSGENITAMKNLIGPLTTYFSDLWTDHPFEKNGFAALNNQFVWGGMENQTLTTICPNCWSTSLIVHEYAHQWFGDMITCETWADIWLNEGFATYAEALWTGNVSGYAAYKNEIVGNATYYKNYNPGWAISNPNWAITTPDVNTLFNNAITYMKSSTVLHMLRYTLGDAVFFDFLKQYANDTTFKYNSATTLKFKNKLNAVTGQDYTWFFDEWIYMPNHPAYTNEYYIAPVGNQWVVGFVAKQNLTTTGFHKMPIEIKVTFNDNTTYTAKVMNDANNQLFQMYFDKQPTAVAFDPNNEIVIKTATLTQIAPLPVELTSFSANTKDEFVVLNWQTETETNNKGFEVERVKLNENGTYDKNNYEKVGFVQGAGNSTTNRSYSFVNFIKDYGKYAYRLKQIDLDGTYEYSSEVYVTAGIKPVSFRLAQNYPNPFNPTTVIQFELPQESKITLKVYNLLGEVVSTLINETYPAGVHTAEFDASNLTSGVYIYELSTDAVKLRQKMILQK